jgi:type VI secretion system protein ImpC
MPEAEAFLQTIREHPEDDALRLVYADWLEERGDCQGEFIRSQIALTRGGRDRHEERALRRRERELLERFGAAWAEPVVRQGLTPWFRRGLPQPAERATPPHDRPRPRRVRLLYPSHVGSLTAARELTFVVGVLADLSGQRLEGRPPLSQRPVLSVDPSSFDAVLARVGPNLHLEVPGGLAGTTPPGRLDLHFERLADFHPARLAQRIPALRDLLQERQREAAAGVAPARLQALDRQLSVHLAAVLHHPDFRRLESAWRGLHYLVHQTATGEDLKVRVLDVRKQELSKDFDPCRPLDRTDLYQKMYREEYGEVDGEPYGLLVADYEFSHHAEDVQLLTGMAGVAAAAHAPLIAGASPKIFQAERFTELADLRDLPALFKGGEYAAWQSFRDSDDSRYVALTLPRVRSRLPYGPDPAHGLGFPFEEFVGGADDAGGPWMSAAWAYAARMASAFADFGWFYPARGVRAGGRVENLPVATSPADADVRARQGRAQVSCPAEIAISDRREFEFSFLGFLLLLCGGSRGDAVFMGARSCQRPRTSLDPAARADSEQLTDIGYTLCVSRFAHYLKVMSRDLLAASVPVERCQQLLGEWLRRYSLSAEEREGLWHAESYSWESDASRPITDVALELRPNPQRSGYELTVVIRPFLMLEDMAPPAYRLVMSVPRLI